MTDRTQYKFLPLTLSMETAGGIVVPLVRRGTPLPAKRQQQFTTVADNQKAIAVEIYLGESPIASNNIHLGKVELNDIPHAPRGEPMINVTIEVDADCTIKVTAIEKKSGKAVSSEVEKASANLTSETIQEMLRKANDSRREDQALADRIETINKANALVHRAEKYLQSQQKYGLSNSTDKQIEDTLASVGLSLQDDDTTAIRDKSNRLEELLPKGGLGNFGDLFGADMFSGVFGPAGPQPQRARTGGAKPEDRKAKDPTPKETPQSQQVAESKKGLFTAGQQFDAKRAVRDLFAQALREVVIIDAYVGEDILNLLTVKRHEVHVRILTGKVSPAFLTLSRDFNRQYKNLEVRSSKAFHDRFVIVDDTEFYHFGASLEHLGNKAFMFSKLEEPAMITALRNHWRQAWDQASQVS